MSVLTLTGKPINWAKPPKPTDRVLWSQRDMYGRKVTGSLRTIAHLDTLNTLARAKFGSGVVVIQPPYNTGVKASAGTHDYDSCWDGYIPGVPWREQETWLRSQGFACWWRRPPKFGNHIHGFTLPVPEGKVVSDDFKVGGFTVGKYVDGGYSLYGRLVASSQIADYYEHRTGLAGHAVDRGSWFPPNIPKTVFDLNAYIATKRKETKVKVVSRPLALSWNLLTKRKPRKVQKELSALIRANKRPKFVALQESGTYRSSIKAVAALLRYKVHQPKNAKEKPQGVQVRNGGECALLIKRNVPISEKGALRMTRTWFGPRGGLIQEGRVFPWVVAPVAGAPTLVVCVHMPTGKNGAARNRKAWDETIAAIEALADSKALPYIIVGDWNDRWSSTDKRSPAALAARTGGKVKHTNASIDYALVRGLKVRLTKGSKRGSDHPAIRIHRKKA